MNRFVALILTVLLSSNVIHAASSEPFERTQQFVEALLAVKKNDEVSYQKVDGFINFDFIMTTAIKPNLDKFKDDEAAKFKRNLIQLIRLLAYPRAESYFKNSRYTFKKAKPLGNNITVLQAIYLPIEDIDVDLNYTWQKFAGEWQIVDISLDDDSMLQDYQNQFSRIIEKQGAESLQQKVAEKLLEAEKKQKQ